ncbi:MAG TPA: type VI secretion system contractile sheath large subunit, partial [Candidatus Nanopelagicales bacterium]|nr:type VI secretion system contractile sheath large subunit [Candidatus Nanopelagicales bacterium]
MSEDGSTALSPVGAPGGTAPAMSLLDEILAQGMVRGNVESQKQHARDLIDEFVSQVLDQKMKVDKDAVAAIEARIAEIDARISAQLDAILHDDKFQKVEARWRGLHYLVTNTETSTRLKLRVLNVKKDELRKEFEGAADFDRSAIFKKVYEEEYGTFGGAPYGLLVGDYEFDGTNPDIYLLTELSKVAAAAHSPFISAASPDLFDMPSFTQIGVPGDLAKLFESTTLIKWREFRETEDSRYVGLTLPHVLMRLP